MDSKKKVRLFEKTRKEEELERLFRKVGYDKSEEIHGSKWCAYYDVIELFGLELEYAEWSVKKMLEER